MIPIPDMRPLVPSQGEVDGAVAQLYQVDDREFVLRPKDVSNAVSIALGVPWSPNLGRLVRLAVEALGGQRIILREALYACIRPRGIPRREALRRSRELRVWTRKRWLR